MECRIHCIGDGTVDFFEKGKSCFVEKCPHPNAVQWSKRGDKKAAKC